MMSPSLQKMVALVRSVDGLYVLTDARMPGAIVPLMVNQGRIHSMKVDSELDPTRFIEGAKFTGPVFQFPGLPVRSFEKKVKAGSVEILEP